jgi:hypothetical protein
MVNPNLIMRISTIPDLFVVEIFEIVEIYVNFDHLMIKCYYGLGQNGHFAH